MLGSNLAPRILLPIHSLIHPILLRSLHFIPRCTVIFRSQMAHSPYRNVFDCVRKMAKSEGLGGFYKSYRTTLVMGIPFQALHFAVYEGAKKLLLEPVLWRNHNPVSPSERSPGQSMRRVWPPWTPFATPSR